MKNLLHYYLNLLRENQKPISSEKCGMALQNILNTMAVSRNSQILNENFDNLDFGNIILNNIDFSDNGKNASHFRGSKLSEWNIRGGIVGKIFRVEFSDDEKHLLTFGNDGKIVVWDIATHSMEKVIDAFPPFVKNSYGDKAIDIVRSKIFFNRKIRRKTTAIDFVNIPHEPTQTELKKIHQKFLSDYFSLTEEMADNPSESELNDEFKKQVIDILAEFGIIHQLNSNTIQFDENTNYSLEVNIQESVQIPFQKGVVVNAVYETGSLLSHISNIIYDTFEIFNHIFEDTDSKNIYLNLFGDNHIVFSNQFHFFAVYSDSQIYIYDIKKKLLLFHIKRNINDIIAVDIDKKQQLAVSKAIYDNSDIYSYFFWDLPQNTFTTKKLISDTDEFHQYIKDQSSKLNENHLDFWFHRYVWHFLSYNLLHMNEQKNIKYDVTMDDDFDMYFWEKYYSTDQSFCIQFEHNEGRSYFTKNVDSLDKVIPEGNFDGDILCGMLTPDDGIFCIFTDANMIYGWNTETEQFVFEKSVDTSLHGNITSAHFSTDAESIIAGTDWGEVLILATATGKIQKVLYHIHSLNMVNCDVTGICASETTKQILFQNGAFFSESN